MILSNGRREMLISIAMTHIERERSIDGEGLKRFLISYISQTGSLSEFSAEVEKEADQTVDIVVRIFADKIGA